MVYRRNGWWVISLLLALMISPAALAAGGTLFEAMDPDVSYSAWRVVETGDRRMKMREHHAPGKMRFEMAAQGQEMVMIQHLDSGESWMLMPQMRRYMQTSAAQIAQSSGSGMEILEQTRMGKEQVNGYSAIKYKASFRDPQGRKGSGYFWVTEDHGIPIKTDMIQSTRSGKERIHMELTDLQIGPQRDSLFEVPDSYQAMPNMGGMGMPGMAGGQGMPPGGGGQGDYMEQLEQMQAKRAREEEQRRAREEAERQALSQLTLDYLEGCWFPTREAAQIRVNSDGSYDVGTPAGSGYAMSRMGDSVEEFRQRFEGLVSKSQDRFVARGRHRETVYERGDCVAGSHGVAGSGNSGQEAAGESAVDQAADKVKKGIGSFFKNF